MATPLMNLDLPIVSTTLGPQWANQLNAALDLVDSHDHSNGKGTTVKTAGLLINADLSFNSFRASDLMATKYATQGAPLSGPTNAQSLFSYNGDLYYVSGAGAAVQLTAGGSIIATPSVVNGFAYANVNTDIVISGASTDVVLVVDTTSPRSVTLPAASSVSAGRLFVIKDGTGNSEVSPLSILPTGLDLIDGSVSQILTSNYGSVFLICNGTNSWAIV